MLPEPVPPTYVLLNKLPAEISVGGLMDELSSIASDPDDLIVLDRLPGEYTIGLYREEQVTCSESGCLEVARFVVRAKWQERVPVCHGHLAACVAGSAKSGRPATVTVEFTMPEDQPAEGLDDQS